jgi:hypothetical protein
MKGMMVVGVAGVLIITFLQIGWALHSILKSMELQNRLMVSAVEKLALSISESYIQNQATQAHLV